MVFDITQVKKIRKQLGLTQHQFAKQSGISQSMLAKLESNKLDPTYSKVKQIEEALEMLSKKHEKVAEEIMVKKIFSVSPNDKLKKAIKLMNFNSISQVPVIHNNVVLGIVSEGSVLRTDLSNIETIKVEEIMDETPPMIAPKTNIKIVKQLLSHFPVILVKKKGKLIGIISKSDVINSIVH